MDVIVMVRVAVALKAVVLRVIKIPINTRFPALVAKQIYSVWHQKAQFRLPGCPEAFFYKWCELPKLTLLVASKILVCLNKFFWRNIH
jgi:hypothetical protein